jgi:hypothetical protein
MGFRAAGRLNSKIGSMLKPLATCKTITVEAINTFCWDAFIVVLGTGAFLLLARWWISKSNCMQSASRSCEIAIFIDNYSYFGLLLGITLALVLVVVKWLHRMALNKVK